MELELVVIENKTETRKSWIISAAIIVAILLIASLIHVTTVTDPPITLPETKEVPLEFMELQLQSNKPGGSSGGSGTPNNTPLNKTNPPQQTATVTTKDPNATAVQSGQSNKTNTDKPSTNTPTTSQQSKDPFGKGGSGGGNQGGSGGLFGADSGKDGNGSGGGNGDGIGSGNGKTRIRHNNINVDNIYTNTLVKVSLILTVNEDGKVIAARTIGKETTTNDQNIINQVIAACKAQLRYEKANSITENIYTVEIKPK